ncbi:hypothetical protein [Thalassomonas sp. M1454]|uniref:hypothetical protein n=1 Tax=Thalassomonas sp. M1454 TaxID=2594477 RepID=UPI00117E2890|nr:hypothetical protein [Thalassomonas sp. M1454]TRX56556.1 hypothetical protein FNN08_03215 [Thalassomonas sp. M1454]
MKPILLLLTVFSFASVASEPLSPLEVKEVQKLLAEAASKAKYVDEICEMPISAEKFKELSKIKAFSEGYETIEGISWEAVKDIALKEYDELKKQAPDGQYCDKYLADLKGNYRFLKDTSGK